MFRGTITDAPDFDATADAEALYNAMKGFGESVPHSSVMLTTEAQRSSFSLSPCWLNDQAKNVTRQKWQQNSSRSDKWMTWHLFNTLPCVSQAATKRPSWTWSPQGATHRGRKLLQHTSAALGRYMSTITSFYIPWDNRNLFFLTVSVHNWRPCNIIFLN